MKGILVDTSVWVDHFRRGNAALANLLEINWAMTHPLVLGEMGCGLIDLQLLASTLITPNAELWTLDKRLATLAQRFGVAHRPHWH